MAVISAAFAAAPARAVDPLGFYLGAGVGHSQVRDLTDAGLSTSQALSAPNTASGTTGWKVIAGVRPLSIIGVEAQYTDFESAHGNSGLTPVGQGVTTLTASSHPKATSLFAVAYLPVPLPKLDVFAKAGVAELKSSRRAEVVFTCLPSNPNCGPPPIFLPLPYSASSTSIRVVYGAGVQVKLSPLAVRAEYERIHSSTGDPDLLSLALTWSLL